MAPVTDEGFLINHSNVRQFSESDLSSLCSKEYWHKFILENGGLHDKDVMLQAILDSINPIDLVPVKYMTNGNDAYFLARNCKPAIEKFCSSGLAPIKLGSEQVILSIQTRSIPIENFKVNMQFHLKKAIEKRYNESRRGSIDLSSFHREPELCEVLFCPLSRPRFLLYVLSVLKRLLSVNAINLSNNDIENLKPLEILKEFGGLEMLDLSNNKINDPEFIELIGKVIPSLKEINLNGNPICSRFNSELEYAQWIQNIFPVVYRIDGVEVNYKIPHQQIWLCSNKAWLIANEFIKHYFTLFDDNRQVLEQTYDKDAIFSMTCDHPPNQNFKDSKLQPYQVESKSLLKTNGVMKIMGPTHQTNTEIVKVLWKLPLTAHDPYSFKVDLLHFEKSNVILVVSGTFKDLEEASRIRSFNRTFALKKVAKDEYKITNDLYHVTDGTADETNCSFTQSVSPEKQKHVKPVVNEEEERNIVEVVSRLTEMNAAYSKRCLEDCGWDVKRALEVFLENYQIFSIPPEAFVD